VFRVDLLSLTRPDRAWLSQLLACVRATGTRYDPDGWGGYQVVPADSSAEVSDAGSTGTT
jgi:hypothetical protein